MLNIAIRNVIVAADRHIGRSVHAGELLSLSGGPFRLQRRHRGAYVGTKSGGLTL